MPEMMTVPGAAVTAAPAPAAAPASLAPALPAAAPLAPVKLWASADNHGLLLVPLGNDDDGGDGDCGCCEVIHKMPVEDIRSSIGKARDGVLPCSSSCQPHEPSGTPNPPHPFPSIWLLLVAQPVLV
jgi:hypothetical protein